MATAEKIYARKFIYELSEGDQVVIDLTKNGAITGKVEKVIRHISSGIRGKIGAHQIMIIEGTTADGEFMQAEEDVLLRHEAEFNSFEKVGYDEVCVNDTLLYTPEGRMPDGKKKNMMVGKVIKIEIEEHEDTVFKNCKLKGPHHQSTIGGSDSEKGFVLRGHVEKKIYVLTKYGPDPDILTDTTNSHWVKC